MGNTKKTIKEPTEAEKKAEQRERAAQACAEDLYRQYNETISKRIREKYENVAYAWAYYEQLKKEAEEHENTLGDDSILRQPVEATIDLTDLVDPEVLQKYIQVTEQRERELKEKELAETEAKKTSTAKKAAKKTAKAKTKK